MANKISVTILTKNSSKYLKECLSALQRFDEIILLDNGSTDNTMEIAAEFSNVKIYRHEFIGFGDLKILASNYTQNDWVLSIDSDEIFSKELVDEVLSIPLDKKSIYSIKRDNYYNGKHIQCCSWGNDYVYRLYNKSITNFNKKKVHESIVIKETMSINKLKHTFIHYSYDNVDQLIYKMDKYASLFAQEHQNTKKATPLKALLRAMFSFIKNYFFQKGFLCGYEGLLISITNANGVFYKYIKLYEQQTKGKKDDN